MDKWLKKLLRHRTLTRHLDREARRPFRHDLAQIDRLCAAATNIERKLASTVESRVAPYVRAKRYFESESNRITFLGAKGEELVLDALRALPDEFTVISDVRVDLGRSARWRARPGVRVRSAQIDHVVVCRECDPHRARRCPPARAVAAALARDNPEVLVGQVSGRSGPAQP